MSRPSRTLCSLIGCLFTAAIWGCSRPAVQEDRSINYSAEGSGVAFQHGDAGVFIASSDGQSLEQIHNTEDALAVSSPLWSPVDGRLIFTTAQSAAAKDENVRPMAAWDANPEGREFVRQQVAYTCWLREQTADSEPAPPLAVFTARCDHPGYVAANLAVRWHPSGKRILFLDQDQQGGLSLFEFDLATKARRRLIEHRASAMVFDWSPSHRYLTCSLLGVQDDQARDGIWVRAEEDAEWWQVPQSAVRRIDESLDSLEQLRKSEPAWTSDDEQFAFIAEHHDEHPLQKIVRAAPGSQTVTQLYESKSMLRDLRWQPNSRRLAFVDSADGSLRIIDEAESVSEPVNRFAVRYFVGWNHDGSKLAYIAPEPAPQKQSEWTLLFPAVAGARDRVYIADGEAGDAARLVHYEVRITFPQWSPSRDDLSLWGTYAPTHVSLLSMVLPWSLRPGDPAAILDCATGEMRWMAVNSHERSQVGHYYLLKRDYDEAWRWYEKAAEDRPAAEPIKLADFDQLMRQRRIFQNSLFFESYCLRKLGRLPEAEQRLKEFRRSMSVQWEDADLEPWGPEFSGPEAKAQLTRCLAFLTPMLQSVYMTEVFLSLNAAEDGVEFFRQQSEGADSDAELFAGLLCLSQLLLATGAHEEYAALVVDRLSPLVIRLLGPEFSLLPQGGGGPSNWTDWIQQYVVAFGGGIATLPMASADFAEQLPEEHVRRLIARWETLREGVTSDELRLVADLVTAVLLARIGDERHQEMRGRVATNPVVLARNEDGFPDVERVVTQLRDIWLAR